jgi:hypothetical protein
MKRFFKIVRKVVLGAVLAFAAFAGGDFAVRMLTQDSKPLTPEQIKKAKTVFGNNLDYSKVRIAFGKISYFESPKTVVVIGNTIHYPPKDPPPDPQKTPEQTKPRAPLITIGYSQPSPKAESDLFMHEMTHVWQNQHDIKGTGIAGAVMLWAKGLLSHTANNVYAYKLDKTKTLTDYNIEQQAEIVGTYYTLKRNALLHPDQPLPKDYALLKKTVEQYIPPAAPHRKSGAKAG